MRTSLHNLGKGGREMNSQVEEKVNTIFIAILMVIIIAFWFFIIPS